MSQQLGIKVDLPKDRWAFDEERSVFAWTLPIEGIRPTIMIRTEITAEEEDLLEIADERITSAVNMFPDARLWSRRTEPGKNKLSQSITGTATDGSNTPVVITSNMWIVPGVHPHTRLCYELALVADESMTSQLGGEFESISSNTRIEVTES